MSATQSDLAVPGFTDIVEALSEPALLCRRGGEVLTVNRAARRYLQLGYSALQHIGDLPWQKKHKLYNWLQLALIQDSTVKGKAILDISGNQQWLHISCTGVKHSTTGVPEWIMLRISSNQNSAVFRFKELTMKFASLNKQLKVEKHHSSTDPLTGLRNRRFFYHIMKSRYQAHNNARFIGSICLIDIDHFKKVNDRLGHTVGDRVLIEVADELRRQCRREDIVCRWGGEEFLLFLAYSPLSESANVLQRIQQAIKERVHCEAEQPFKITVSAGLVELDRSLDDAINLCDDALYAAKQNGRDRIEVKTY
ncbi:GGDEF domain-containing protein [Aestuariibacter salexigens]|uniref:GGDEF domain-containing protein n=1 Tax=Aestuariibacter salexigens TaxID=226010 RepID=UPI0004214759|nr:GGDEF domain-containing protein [Aestuariibacter salexigens]